MSDTTESVKERSSGTNPKECDLIMKGGITSGVVYPLAIVEIAKAFRLRSIGGTSAGAIAAAGAAAAEAGRQRRNNKLLSDESLCRDFALLGELPGYLASPRPAGMPSGLQGMFCAHPQLARLFGRLTAAFSIEKVGARRVKIICSLLAESIFPLLIGMIAWMLPMLYTLGYDLTFASSAWSMIGGLLSGMILSMVVLAARIIFVLRGNGFGLCSGMPSPGDTKEVAAQCLTVWLAHYLDKLSGQADTNGITVKKPLTFGDLKALGIDLQMMTTCVSQGRPYRLPFRDEEAIRENNQFFFKEREFRELFPEYVVDWMVANQRPVSTVRGARPEDDFCRLPEPDNLPVVVAARMSLSFPILLSAIPLYAKDYQQTAGAPERCWFSDGGLTANFPIHFFDAPLPERPTFGLNLGEVQDPSADRVYFPNSNRSSLHYNWNRFESSSALGSLTGFAGAIFNTMQGWNYETQARLPGYRDRIAVIRLTAQEGGLNLAMPSSRILALAEYGREAGIGFVRRFGDCSHLPNVMPENKMNWENHQIIRLRSLIASIGEMLLDLKKGDDALRANPEQCYERFFSMKTESYSFQDIGSVHIAGQPWMSQALLAKHMLEVLLALAAEIEVAISSSSNASVNPGYKSPKPPPEMKLKTRI